MSKDYDQALRKCLTKCPPEINDPEALIKYGFSHGYMSGYSNGYRVGAVGERIKNLRLKKLRLTVATAAMQGLLAGGYLADHSDTAAEAVRQADALLTKITAS